MTSDRDRDLARICQSALERPVEQRPAFLAAACGSNHDLRREAESLLAREGRADSFLEPQALAEAAAAVGEAGAVAAIGSRLGSYVVVSPLGTGGMGEVYRARDDRLHREVAIKILPATFTSDPARLARFEREALALASLNHPNIATIHGIERAHPIHALVLELVEGETLAARLLTARRRQSSGAPLALPTVLSIARQMADALDAAHEKGVVHRDLKPANVMIRPDGVVKVLDFGLAKLASAPEGSHPKAVTPAPTPTRPGTVLGTPGYMSPEQARGEPTDTRTDIWAFGCVLFEMLSGRPVFHARTIPDTLAAVLEHEPDWAALSAGTPAAVERLLRRCLQKDPRRRLQHIGDARIELDDALSEPRSVVVPGPAGRGSRAWPARALAFVAVATAGALAGYSLRGRPEPQEVRLDVSTPPTNDAASLAVSPDGRQFAFVALADGQSRLWLRSLETGTARALKGTENAKLPFWSPDGRSIGFTSSGLLKRIDIDNGFVQSLTDAHGGGTWRSDGTILFDPGPGADIFRISATGGEPARITNLGPNGNDPWSPRFLPDERHFLIAVTGSAPGIYVGELGGSGPPRHILEAQAAVLVPPSHLFFVRDRRLHAQAFDVRSLRLTGSPTTVAEQLVIGAEESTALAASASGTVVFRQGGPGPQSQFAWFDRSGRRLSTIEDSTPADGFNFSMSPDERWLAFSSFAETAKGRTADIWLLDLQRGVPSRFTSDAMFDLTPVWAPDSRTLAFASNRARPDGSSQSFDVYLKPVEGPGREEFLVGNAQGDPPSDWSGDGRFVLYNSGNESSAGGQGQSDVWAIPVNGDRRPFPVVATRFNESNAQFSPDGAWVAYQSNEAGRSEVYLQPFPGPGARIRVSRDGGDQVRWRRDGKELFFLTPDDRLMAVSVQLGPDAGRTTVGTPAALFAAPLSGTPRHVFARHYSVSRDGQRFLMDTRKEVTLPITILFNWKPRRE